MFLRNSQEASYQNWRTWENSSLLLPWMWFGPHIRNIHSFFTKLYMQSCGTMLSLITFMPYWIALLAELAFVYHLYLALGLSMGISACRLLMIIQVSLCGYQWSFFRFATIASCYSSWREKIMAHLFSKVMFSFIISFY